MSVSSATSRIVYTGNNSLVTAYAVPFYFEENAHLNAIAKTAAGVETVVNLTNHTGAGDPNGGTVRTAVAVPATSTLTIYREVPFTQTTIYEENDGFPADSHERALDKLTTITQQLERRIGNCIRGTEATPLSPLPSPTGTQQFVLTASANQPPSWQEQPALAVGPVIATGSTQARFLSDRFADVVNVKDFGAVGDGVADDTAAFTAAGNANPSVRVPRGQYRLNSNPTPAGDVTWMLDKGVTLSGAGNLSFASHKILSQQSYRSLESNPSHYGGVFEYLEKNAALSGYGTLGIHGCVTSSGGGGGAGEADIAVSAFASHNLAGSQGGVWGLYSTVLRESGVLGATHGLEIDVANFGSAVTAYPAQTFPQGLTAGIWCAVGGETTVPSAGGAPGVATVGIAIVRNDSQVTPTAKFRTGILFHNVAIEGADGTGGIGQAIAFASGHAMQWLNNSNEVCAEIVGTATNQSTSNCRLVFDNGSVFLQDRATGFAFFVVPKIANAVNRLQLNAATAGNPVIINAEGSDSVIDLTLAPKGGGFIRYGTHAVKTTETVTGFITIKDASGTTRKLAVLS